MRLLTIFALIALAAGCASSGGHQDGSTSEPHFSAHEGRPATEHRSSGGGQSGDDGDGVLDTILGVLFGGDDA